MKKAPFLDQPNKCVHCEKQFMAPRTLFSHMCEQKRRVMQKDEKRVQAGYLAFNRFFEITQNSRKKKTYEEFCKTAYYNAFVKFGSFVNNVNPLYPDKFVDFVIKSGVKLDHWCRDELYEKYLYEMLKIEPVESAVQRSIATMIEWGETNSADYTHYFKYVNLNRIVHDIRDGKISCWILLNCKTGKEILSHLSDDQLEMITSVLDMPFWIKKFKENPEDVSLVKEICKETGIE
jgi:hypothetical protein